MTFEILLFVTFTILFIDLKLNRNPQIYILKLCNYMIPKQVLKTIFVN